MRGKSLQQTSCSRMKIYEKWREPVKVELEISQNLRMCLKLKDFVKREIKLSDLTINQINSAIIEFQEMMEINLLVIRLHSYGLEVPSLSIQNIKDVNYNFYIQNPLLLLLDRYFNQLKQKSKLYPQKAILKLIKEKEVGFFVIFMKETSQTVILNRNQLLRQICCFRTKFESI